jgi:hypothetical protein
MGESGNDHLLTKQARRASGEPVQCFLHFLQAVQIVMTWIWFQIDCIASGENPISDEGL